MKQNASCSATDIHLLSVVVIGRNEGERLEACLASVQQMQRGSWDVEVLYVDSGSTDDSLALAASFGARCIALQPQRPTAALARNAGWTQARGEMLLFLDGDTVLSPDFVRDSMLLFADPTLSIVWGHRREAHPKHSIYNRVLDLDWVYAPGPAEFCGGDALVRRSALEAAGGFDPALIAGEEPELCRRILAAGYRILHVDRTMTLHDLDIFSFTQYWRRALRAGHAYAEVADRFKQTPDPFWSKDVQHNRNRAMTIVIAGVIVFGVALALRSGWPVAAGGALFCLIVLRTAWKARWKSHSIATLLLYGVHAQLQQLPIYCGQLQFQRNRRLGAAGKLIEYKRS